MHSPESDIDFVVYGTENFRLVEEAIARLVNEAKFSYIVGNRIEAARKFQGRYQGKIFMYNATKQPEQVTEKYGAYRYVPLDPVRFQATVCDDTETMYRPAIYKITGYKPQDDQSETRPRQNPDTSRFKHWIISKCCPQWQRHQSRRQTGTGRINKHQRGFLPSGCWNRNLRGRIHLASNLKLRDRDAIETAEGLIFRVFGYSHPSNAYICDAEYASAKIFQSKDPRAPRTGKGQLYYKFYNDEGMKLVAKKYPQYMVFHEMLGLNLVGVKDNAICGSKKT